ncbi:hypothetical protein ADK64_36565 [Streptomyces sp. MMG1121]|nr:hypothetical protein ADK64_36565 [Streptomyces sp. MMG1121]
MNESAPTAPDRERTEEEGASECRPVLPPEALLLPAPAIRKAGQRCRLLESLCAVTAVLGSFLWISRSLVRVCR